MSSKNTPELSPRLEAAKPASIRFSRRTLWVCALSVAHAAFLMVPQHVPAADPHDFNIRWVVPKARMETIETLFSEHSIAFEEREPLVANRAEPVTILVTTMAVASLVTTIFELYQRWDNPGIIIDARDKDLRVSSQRGLDPGTVVVLSARETVAVEVTRDRSSLDRLAAVVGEATK